MCLHGNYRKVHASKYFLDVFSIHNGLQQGDALITLLFFFSLSLVIIIYDYPRNSRVAETEWECELLLC
jgi:hypothetical protein